MLIEALGIPDSERWHVNVKLNRYDPHSFAVAGNATDELDDLGHRRRRPGRERRARLAAARCLLGFAVGAYAGYRWLAGRVGTDAMVDAAPPIAEQHRAAADGTHAEVRATAPSAPATEY